MMSVGKRGSSVGEAVELIPAFVVISVIAVVVFGISSTAYAYEISVRDAEARLLGITVMECLAGDGVLSLDELRGVEGVFDHCGILGGDRFYVNADIFDADGNEVANFKEGDSGLLWVRDLILTGNSILGENGGG